MPIESAFVDLLRCPVTRTPLLDTGDSLVAEEGGHSYRVSDLGIPLFAEGLCSDDGRRQQQHYDKVAQQYLANLGYPHTQEYTKYLDDAFFTQIADANLDLVAEICCGGGEAFQLLGDRVNRGIGVDVSVSMLSAARRKLASDNYFFLQGDATMLPLDDEVFDSVFIFGGIHHVNDRYKLFREVFRVLKPGGRFYWREPVSDFFLWRWLRAVIYNVSSSLDADTERPLLLKETKPPLDAAGLILRNWRTYGFLGYCLLMNSDVLVFNRAFKYLPGIRAITRFATRLDDWTMRLPGMNGAGLIAIGMAEKPMSQQA